jgi:hypothetical protein
MLFDALATSQGPLKTQQLAQKTGANEALMGQILASSSDPG